MYNNKNKLYGGIKMKPQKYAVWLTNGTIKSYYEIYASNQEQAVILAQATAINDAKGYTLVEVKEIK